MSSNASHLPSSLILVGAGKMGGSMLEGWIKVGMKPEGVTVLDPKPSEEMTRFCREKGIALVDDYDAVLASKDVDAVVLATPHSQHGDQVRRAAAAGKHVFVEKPFTLTADDARRAIDAATKAGIVLAVGFNRRFHPSMAELRARIRDGRLGVIETCVVEQTAGTGPTLQPGHWRADPSESRSAR